MEIWNLVFMQNIRGEGSTKEDYPILGELPAKNIDTGMGLERLASVLQGVDNLYEIDEVYPVLERAAQLAGKRYGAHSRHDAAHSHPDDVRLRVVADHVRTSLMLIGDGVTPGNEGRGYVLRRMLRRAVRSMRLLGVEQPCLPELLPISMERMKQSYPELERDFGRISTHRLRRGGGVPAHPRGRHDDPRHRGDARQVRRPLDPRRRRGVRAARHLRLPDRPDPGDGGRAGRRGRRGGLPPADDRAAPAGQGRRPGEEERAR